MHHRSTQAVLIARLATALCIGPVLATQALAAPVTQSTAPAGSSSYQDWAWQQLGSVSLATGTNSILGLTSTVTLADQGWGGQDPNNNQVIIGLFDNGAEIWGQHVAGAYHQQTTQTYDILTSPDALLSLDTALGGIDWSSSQAVTLQMEAVPVGYQGWQLITQNASFSVTSDVSAVPEPSTIAVFGLALATITLVSRRMIGKGR